VAKLEPVIGEKFDDFCASHLRKLVEKYPEAGTLIPKLANMRYHPEVRLLPFQPFVDTWAANVLPTKMLLHHSVEVTEGVQLHLPTGSLKTYFTVRSDCGVPAKWPKLYYFELTLGASITDKYTSIL
jgi:hypothetical protein